MNELLGLLGWQVLLAALAVALWLATRGGVQASRERRLKPTRATLGARVDQGAATPSMRSNLTTMRPNC
jgi:hypothetical protein